MPPTPKAPRFARSFALSRTGAFGTAAVDDAAEGLPPPAPVLDDVAPGVQLKSPGTTYWPEALCPAAMLAAVIAGVTIYVPLKLLDQLVFDTTRTFGLLLLTGVSGGGGLTMYVLLCWVFGVSEVQSFIRLLKRVRRAREVLLTPAGEVVNGGAQDKLA